MAEVNLRSWPKVSQVSEDLQLNSIAAKLEHILARFARLKSRLVEHERRVAATLPPLQPEPDPPDRPRLYDQSPPPTFSPLDQTPISHIGKPYTEPDPNKQPWNSHAGYQPGQLDYHPPWPQFAGPETFGPLRSFPARYQHGRPDYHPPGQPSSQGFPTYEQPSPTGWPPQPSYYQQSPHNSHYQPNGYGPPTTYEHEPYHQPHSGTPQHPPYSGWESYVQRFLLQDTRVGEENMEENMDSNGQQGVNAIDDLQKLKIKQLREEAAKREISACGTEKELLDRRCTDNDNVVRDNDIVKEEANGEKIVTTVKKDSVVMDYSESRYEPPAQTGTTPIRALRPEESKEEPRIVKFISLICNIRQPLGA
ncbi:hypothetical protein SASPL_107017 [Salvia splendens]|uniref:Uncharacterized protein n=1 Tax=Salvia splendens TaxID=180675 RepID=A0A8X8YAL4_SALSN|nr:hypothetical protein SASPL_107017 [Salvia splendens]